MVNEYICGKIGIVLDEFYLNQEPFRENKNEALHCYCFVQGLLITLFGTGKGSGAAMLFFVIGIFGALSCLPFRADRNIWRLEDSSDPVIKA